MPYFIIYKLQQRTKWSHYNNQTHTSQLLFGSGSNFNLT